MEEFTAFVGLDVHKDSIVPAVAEGGRGGRVEVLGRIPMEARALRRLVERLARRYRHLEFCYEAGPCGYGVYRLLEGLGHRCLVAAPSKLSRAPGEPGEERQVRRAAAGGVAAGRAGGAGLGAGPAARGGAWPGAGAACGGQGAQVGAPAADLAAAGARPVLCGQGALDAAALGVAGRPALRGSGAANWSSRTRSRRSATTRSGSSC